MYPGSNSINGKIWDKADKLRRDGDKEGKIQSCFLLMTMFILIQEALNKSHSFFVYVDIYGGWDEAGCKCETVPTIKIPPVLHDGVFDEGEWTMINMLISFESGGYGIEGIKKDVSHPVAKAGKQSDFFFDS